MRTRHVIVIAGPNGSGKSTVAPFLLRDYLGLTEFANADTIAAGLSAYNPSSVEFEAGRIMLRRLKELADSRSTFAFETTLASRSFAPWLQSLRKEGYQFHLSFLWLPSPEAAVARVEQRVQMGGHDIPEETIRRRYDRGLLNFFRLYRPIADHWRLINGTEPLQGKLVAEGSGAFELKIYEENQWNCLMDKYR